MKAVGRVCLYDNGIRGKTWAAEICLVRTGSLICCYGQKNMKASIAAANKMAAKLGWVLTKPYEKVDSLAAVHI